MSSISIIVFAATLSWAHESDLHAVEEVRAAIQRSIPYIEEKGVWWIDTKKCVSCHRVGTMLWSLSAAQQKGFRVSDRLEEWLNWSLDTSLSKNDKGKIVGAGNKDGLVQLLLTRHHVESTDARRESYARFAAIISNDQEQDGSWHVVSRSRPIQEFFESGFPHAKDQFISCSASAWATLALLQTLPKIP